MDLDKIKILKQAVGLAVGIGVTGVVNSFVGCVTAPETSFQKVVITVGRVSINSFVSSKVREHVDEKFDEGVAWVTDNFGKK